MRFQAANTVWEQIKEPDLKWDELEAMFGEETTDKSTKEKKGDSSIRLSCDNEL